MEPSRTLKHLAWSSASQPSSDFPSNRLCHLSSPSGTSLFLAGSSASSGTKAHNTEGCGDQCELDCFHDGGPHLGHNCSFTSSATPRHADIAVTCITTHRRF